MAFPRLLGSLALSAAEGVSSFSFMQAIVAGADSWCIRCALIALAARWKGLSGRLPRQTFFFTELWVQAWPGGQGVWKKWPGVCTR
jgi:hypothetical protein